MPLINGLYTWIDNYDKYGQGRLVIFMTLYVFTILSLINVIYGPTQQFYLINPAVLAVGLAHSNSISSFKDRYQAFWVFIILNVVTVFIYTTFGYMRYVILLLTFSLCAGAYLYTMPIQRRIHRPGIALAFIIAFLTMYMPGQGHIFVALNRIVTILFSAVIAYAAIKLAPTSLYRPIWRKSLMLYIAEGQKRLKSIINASTYNADLVHEHALKVNSSLNCLQGDSCWHSYTQCYTHFLRVVFGIVYLQEAVNKNLSVWQQLDCYLAQVILALKNNRIIDKEIIKQIDYLASHAVTLPEQHLWHNLSLAIINWNDICHTKI